jgi:hypothetical protein
VPSRALRLLLASALAAPLTLALPAPDAHAADPVDALAVTLVGDGVEAGNVNVPVSIDLLGSDGSDQGAVALPTTAVGTQRAFTLGADRDQQGALQQSADRRYVTLGGYDAAPGTAAVNDTEAPATLRVVARVGADGVADTSTTLGGSFSKRHVRGVASVDGTGFWVGGHGNDAAGAAKGGVVYVPFGGDTPTPLVSGSSALNNGRVPVIADGQLYLSSDRSGHEGVNAVGTGTPTAATTDYAPILTPHPGSEVAHDFAFIGEALYVTYTEGTAGLAKYVRTGATWTEVGFTPGAYWGVTGRTAADDTVLYAVNGAHQGNTLTRLVDTGADTALTVTTSTVATAEPGYAYRGVAFAPGFTPSGDPVSAAPAEPTVTWDARAVNGDGSGLAAVLGATDNPVATGTATVDGGAPVTLAVTGSSDPTVADLPDTTLTRSGDAFTLAVVPRGAGQTTLTLTATTADGGSAVARLAYGVLATGGTDRMHFGMSDASTAVSVGDGHLLVADDDSTPIRLYDSTVSDYPVSTFDFSTDVPALQSGEAWDTEASAVDGDTVYWIGSMGNSRSGNQRPDRDTVVATRITGTGAGARLSYVGSTHGIQQALIAWDSSDAHGLGANAFGFAAATRPGVPVSGDDTLNVEGAEMSPDGTLWLGFRSPLMTAVTRDRAVIIGIENIADVIADDAPVQVTAEPILLDLGGRAIRELRRADDGNYVILAGSADDAGDFAVYGWDGDPDSAPVIAGSGPGVRAVTDGSWEGIADLTSLADGSTATLVRDNGTSDLYGTGTEAADLEPAELRAFSTSTLTLDFGGAFGAVVPAPGELPGELPVATPAPGLTPIPDLGVDPVTGTPTTAAGRLATTGADTLPLIGVAVTLLLTGAAVLLLARRRS